MQCVSVSSRLDQVGLKEPPLSALQPDENNYKVLLFQPKGEIDVNAVTGIRHRDRGSAREQFKSFLLRAREGGADLAVTPEYSMPWEVLLSSLKAGVSPALGKIWALGCESICFSDLAKMKDENEPSLKFLFEDLAAAPGNFVDPLAYVFRAIAEDGNEKIVVLVQFKITPMGGDNFETDNLRKGTTIYTFGTGQSITMASIICSDAFSFPDLAAHIYDRALILHIQLNQDPRNHIYRTYRNSLLDYKNDETEIICLNWAAGVCHWDDGGKTEWDNIGGSAWYTKSQEYDLDDGVIHQNHMRGLYYTWLECSRTHVLFFNYQPALFELNVSKVYQYRVKGPLSLRRGPQLAACLIWDSTSKDWAPNPLMDDGFSALSFEAGKAQTQLIALATQNPIAAERVITLCAGDMKLLPNWYAIKKLTSCEIDATEIIKRVTFCQDPNTTAKEFRVARLKRCGQIFSYLEQEIPTALNDFREGFQIDWHPSAPHQNASAKQGRATLVNFGDSKSDDDVKQAANFLANYLQRTANGELESRHAKQRMAIWYRDAAGEIQRIDGREYTQIDKIDTGPPFDITGDTS